eukprot:CAMPEP_0113451466 /NCGR_PEP_ID=MMETSP0014_2-20120614/6352_1 /TAXON_ID=2857 /ORGANISM="Nitzschia sp." /LENGTH=409 /DNA_ID=CAMNT_0000342821 /DNA_START=435 /DNA_END=1664 /DNA_ORIENTATION=- /assembly_acc=CAM_ASM_000159
MSSPDQQQEQYDADDDCQYIFPQRLMSILRDERNHDAICWLPHGRGFIIRNRKLFAEKVMPRFFPRKSKYSSFTRKLNRWNFNRVSSGPELGAYYHEFFLREKPHLAAQMFCKSARTKLAMATDIPKPVPAAMVAPQPQAKPQQQVVAPPQPPAPPVSARPSTMVGHHQHHHSPTAGESMPPAARGSHIVSQPNMMKPASPVVIHVVDGQGNPEPFASHNPQHMDQAMQYLMQHQFHHFEPQPFQSENNHISSGSDGSMAVSPTPIHQGAPMAYHHHQQQPQQPVPHHYNHGRQYHPSNSASAAAAAAGQVHHHHHHQQQQPSHGHGYVEHHHHQHQPQQMYHSAHDGGNSSSCSSITANGGNRNDMNVWQQVEQHKQEDERMNELRQMMAVNMQQRNHHKNSYRASAA